MKPGGQKIAILGSTGSVGVNTLNVIRSYPHRFQAAALAAGRNVKLLAEQIAEFKPRAATVLTKELAEKLRSLLDPALKVEVAWGEEGYEKIASLDEAETVVSAMVGAAGLRPTWAAVRSGKRVALANKETLVMGGELIMAEAESRGAQILPVDSEHSAIFQVLCGQNRADVKRLILTASGGPFLNKSPQELAEVTSKEALAHPQWTMGAKISVDSATLMNKGLETIEARWLFGFSMEKIDIQIHPQSIVHSMVEFVDGAILAQMGCPDMRVPIAYALSYPERLPLDLPCLDLPCLPDLNFRQPDLEAFPCLALALEAGRSGGTSPVILNAANEVAVQSFLNGELNFLDISLVVRETLRQKPLEPLEDLEHIVKINYEARQKAKEIIAEMGRVNN
ncbi:MAG: 1-deoxy-D-xylulose-5-phosphate reductoisomerase [Deltaproteobacteria bacterium]|nr:1-deoxy-D-xylulose-5-phosphate reductoisomerase [Deltaproteobacteria bacterium]